MAKSSINLQIAKIFAFLHNTREAIVTYVISDASRNEYDGNGQEAYKYYLDLLAESTSNYTTRTKQRIQTDEKKFLWEAVINLNQEHTLKNVQELAGVLSMTYGWQPVHIAVHRDEGHIDQESGKNIYNHHAHIVFFMLNKQGIYCFKKRDFGIKKMEELQTSVARVLNMERGVSKKITKRVRLEHPQYKQLMQSRKEEQTQYNILHRQMNMLSMKISRLRKNKKKTASKIRTLTKRMKNDDDWKKLSLFCTNSKDALFNGSSKYPLLDSNDIFNVDLILEWMKVAQEEILYLLSENKILLDVHASFDGKVYQELEPECNKMSRLDQKDEEECSMEDKSQLPQVEEEMALKIDKDFESDCLIDSQHDSDAIHTSEDPAQSSKLSEYETDDELHSLYEEENYEDKHAEEVALDYVLSMHSNHWEEHVSEDKIICDEDAEPSSLLKLEPDQDFPLEDSEVLDETESESETEDDTELDSDLKMVGSSSTVSKIDLEPDPLIESDIHNNNNEKDSIKEKNIVQKSKNTKIKLQF